ncbi:hypothetical protein CFOL_v3_12874 [Cephalotus follicularis]|uniref:Hapless 8 n=1 Tax=Cephalotus follicularis TaxID=3775 RepID=A0A1Q3BNU1_CEPFO|nr:hypothetical protein CFOL_v3_12874 [Cephalotus follicularis]
MLSIENPPPDPSCSCQFSQLKTVCSDEIESASHKLPFPLPLPEVDLPKSPHTPLPNFSIRDYVCSSRSKDIKKNWPFSLKSLQLCLTHGVKDVLPPFQPLNTVRNQSIKGSTVESSSLEKENVENVDWEICRPNDHAILHCSVNAKLNQKLPDPCLETTSSCRSEGENDFPCTTSVSQSEIESVHNNRPSSSSQPIETDTLFEPSVEVEAAPPVSHKTETTTRSPGKKCRLIVKFGGHTDRCSTEDIVSNCPTVSETMASKVCPVCKTFSSSSNTTLNAHIDQCLSVESTPKWTADSRLTKHRIKPRRTRLMVDIYTTAKQCTLEELDRRNGTNWATIASVPSQRTEKVDTPAEGKKQRFSQVHPEDVCDVGPVYIDANGTKLRILSKSNELPPVSKVEEYLAPRKPLKGSKGSKFLSTKKKKHTLKHHKYLKLASQSKKFYSPKAPTSQISGDQERHNGEEESCEEGESRILMKQTKSSDIGNLRQWVRSKRTGLAKKTINQDGHQPSKWHLKGDLLVDSDQSCLGDSLVERNRVPKFMNLSQNMLSSTENVKRTEKAFYDARFSDKREHLGRKRFGSPLLETGINDKTEKSVSPMKRSAIQLMEDSPLVHDTCTFKLPSSSRISGSTLSNEVVDIHGVPVNNSDVHPVVTRKPSTASKALKFSSSKKNVSSGNSRSSMIESRYNVTRKLSTLEKTDSRFITENDEDVEAWFSESDQQYDLRHNNTENQYESEDLSHEMPLGHGNVEDFGQDEGAVSNLKREDTMALKRSQPAPGCYGHDEGENTDSSVRACDDVLDKVDHTQSVGKRVTSFGKSVDTKLHKLAIRSKMRSNSLRSIGHYRGPVCGGEVLTGPTDPSFVDGHEMFSNHEVGMGIAGNPVGMELDTEVGEGNSFPEVDPIPIPGPPGSFLPSPRDMGSDDFPGNSSLTTSRVQSSQDQFDLADGGSSDSPISAESTISNSTAPRSYLKFSDTLISEGPQTVEDKLRSGFLASSFGSSVKNAATVLQTSTGAERTASDGETFKVNKIIEKRPLRYRNDDQPCCCQRKEKLSEGIILNYQESPLLRRRAMASLTMPPMGKQLDCTLQTIPNNLDTSPGISPLINLVSEKVVLPVMKSLTGSIPSKESPDAGVKFAARTDGDSASPSNPILRLMGKNLMVVNKDDDASVPLSQDRPCAQVNRLTSQFPTLPAVSSGNLHYQDSHSFHHMLPQGSVISGQDPHKTGRKCFDARLIDSYLSRTSSQTTQIPAHGPAGMFLTRHMDGFTATMEPYNYECDDKMFGQQNIHLNRLNAASANGHEHKNVDFTASTKEVFIIDDVPAESETNVYADAGRVSEGLRQNQLASSGIIMPTVCGYNVRNAKDFSHYQSQNPSLLGGSAVTHNTNFNATAFWRANASPVRWNCTSEDSVVLQRGPFMTAPSSAGHLRSPLYYSPSFP